MFTISDIERKFQFNRVKNINIKLAKQFKKAFKEPCFCFKVAAFALFGFVALLSPCLLNNAGSATLIDSISSVSVKNQLDVFAGSTKLSAPETPEFILVKNSAIKPVVPPVAITPQVLGVWMGEGDISQRATVTEYMVEDGDSLYAIADEFGVSFNTLFWANDLKSLVIRPGQKLLILPVSGVMHITKQGDTISELAKKYKADTEEIITYNNLEGRDLMVDELLIIPGGSKGSTSLISSKTSSSSKLPNNYFGGLSHKYPYGQCTYWVAQKRAIPSWGNAIDWMPNAEKDGYATCRGSYCVPQVGAVAWLTGHRIYGHVGYVEEVKGNKIIISEMNNIGLGVMNYRTIKIGSRQIKGYIY
jgi:surface antigen